MPSFQVKQSIQNSGQQVAESQNSDLVQWLWDVRCPLVSLCFKLRDSEMALFGFLSLGSGGIFVCVTALRKSRRGDILARSGRGWGGGG